MRNRAWKIALLAGAATAACSVMTAEPIANAPGQLSVVDDGSTDPYACAVVEVSGAITEIDGNEVVAFVHGLGGTGGNSGTGYAGVCKQTRQGCWLTGDADAHCTAGTPGCGGFSYDGATNTVTGGQHMVCEYLCTVAADCPTPESGTAQPVCFDLTHTCALGCDAGETCPDGFVCIHPGLSVSAPDGTLVPAPKQCVQYKALDGTLPL